MVRFVVLYPQPTDVAAFEQHYFEIHIPLVKKLPGLRNYTVSRNPTPIRGGAPYYQIAEMDWSDMASLQQGFASPMGHEAGRDVGKLLELCPGIHSMVFELDAV